VEKQKEFHESMGVNFDLLSDPSEEVVRQYGSMRSVLWWLPANHTFVVDHHGEIRHVWRDIPDMKAHGADVVATVKQLQAADGYIAKRPAPVAPTPDKPAGDGHDHSSSIYDCEACARVLKQRLEQGKRSPL